MQQNRKPATAKPAGIISPQYCSPYNVDLAVVRKVTALADNFSVINVNGKVVFNLQASLMSINDHRVLLDAAGKPIVTLRQKIMTTHDRWQAFRGESTQPEDLIFSVKRPSMFQVKTKLEVFLANNTREQVCDFKIKGSWFERSCVVYAGESLTIVAQMHKKNTVQSVAIGKDSFMLTVYPNNDYGFIVALILILDEINQDKRRQAQN
ncbi:protein LURP-one-related 15-like [Lotus japonicus]|uniref:protein LURP-one-related 15-like n=1 Tax=Lotus japonicus TaxID=34305 RepID=UPI00258F952A|nr:protein LURP-one-related 15-like [Lotus japonicus]